ncbi:MAG: hypothetical protein JWP58_421 [Hymenobacter sp.]|nr:hypothetical protein [Hymenobacter sp.]
MNEQLVVKNFGPIKDATVDFKRVTVFIGPTGGGKSTLAKIRMVISDDNILSNGASITPLLNDYGLNFYRRADYFIKWSSTNENYLAIEDDKVVIDANTLAGLIKHTDDVSKPLAKGVSKQLTPQSDVINRIEKLLKEIQQLENSELEHLSPKRALINFAFNLEKSLDKAYLKDTLSISDFTHYVPAERLIISTLALSWPSLIDAKADLPKTLIDFSRMFLQASKAVGSLKIPFLDIAFHEENGQSIIKSEGSILQIHETASGIQSVTPLLVLLEHLSRNTEQAQSFIIEEPELNLFPIAQFELVKTLVEKCARLDGQNDLVLTTHSPYVLTALNLMCYAFRIAQQDEATAKKVAKLIPRHCWIDPEQFAAYYVDRPDTKRKQQVRSIINKKTGLIEENELDTASEELSNIFDKLLDLRQPVKVNARAK